MSSQGDRLKEPFAWTEELYKWSCDIDLGPFTRERTIISDFIDWMWLGLYSHCHVVLGIGSNISSRATVVEHFPFYFLFFSRLCCDA